MENKSKPKKQTNKKLNEKVDTNEMIKKSKSKKQINKKTSEKVDTSDKREKVKSQVKLENKIEIRNDGVIEKKKVIISAKVIDWFLVMSTMFSLILDVYAFTEIKNRYYLKEPIYFSLIDQNMSFSIIVIIVNVMVYLFSTLEIVSAIKNKDDSTFMRIFISLFSIFTTLIVVIAFATLVVNFAK